MKEIILVLLFATIGYSQQVYVSDISARAAGKIIGSVTTITQFADTTTNDSLTAPATTYWDLTLASDDSTFLGSFHSTYPATDKFPLKVGESYEYKHLLVANFPKVYYKKASGYSGNCVIRHISKGY